MKFTLAELAAATGAEVVGDADHLITGIEDLESAREEHLSFLENPKYTNLCHTSLAGAILIHPSLPRAPQKNYLLHPSPSLAFQKVIHLFLPKIPPGFSGIHPTAVIHPEATLEEGVVVGPHVVIDRKALIGKGTILGPCVTIGAETRVGQECHFFSHVVIREGIEIGNRVKIQPGAVIGSCGFGYFTDEKGQHHLLEQRGSVVIEDDVEIGANTTIDRARFKTTTIGRGTKIDNLVQIAHQVHLGPDNLIVSQVGIAGSTKTGRNVVLGGQVGVVGHATLADHVIVAARAAVSKSLLKAGIYSGAPATPIKEFNEHFVLLRNIKKFQERLKRVEETINSLINRL